MSRFINKILSSIHYCVYMHRPFYRYYRKKHKSFYKVFSPLSSSKTPGIRQCDRRTAVDIERKFLFNRLPKVASSTFMRTLSEDPDNKKIAGRYRKKHRRPSHLSKQEIKKIEDLFKFIFVR
ncbi:MAG: sulfotransferase family 2 domain-containing protein, partial [Elusimicrobiota bacterium]